MPRDGMCIQRPNDLASLSTAFWVDADAARVGELQSVVMPRRPSDTSMPRPRTTRSTNPNHGKQNSPPNVLLNCMPQRNPDAVQVLCPDAPHHVPAAWMRSRMLTYADC